MPPRRGPLYKEAAAGWPRVIAAKPFSPRYLASAGCGGKRHHLPQLAANEGVQLVLRYGLVGRGFRTGRLRRCRGDHDGWRHNRRGRRVALKCLKLVLDTFAGRRAAVGPIFVKAARSAFTVDLGLAAALRANDDRGVEYFRILRIENDDIRRRAASDLLGREQDCVFALQRRIDDIGVAYDNGADRLIEL
jgi:hypothetical protein